MRVPALFRSFMFLLTFVAALVLPQTAHTQGLAVGDGWAHATGDFGTDGFNVGAAWWFTKQVTIAADYLPGIHPLLGILLSRRWGLLL